MSSSTNDPQQRLTDRAKEILKIADEEAGRLKDAVVRGEHMLMGILKEGTSVASDVLKNMNVDLDSLKKTLSDKLDESKEPDAQQQASAKPVDEATELLKAAEQEADELDHDHVGAEDLLLGIIKNTKSVAGGVLEAFGVQLESAREEVQKAVEKGRDRAESSKGANANESSDGQIELSEKGRDPDGKPITLNRRLFMQFMAFTGSADDVVAACKRNSLQAVVYADVNDTNGVGVMFYCEDPGYLFETAQPALQKINIQQKQSFTMLGRTYSIGYENNLEEVLIRQPVKRICDPKNAWGVFYPLRRSGMFERESKDSQRKMLMEHGGIGHAFGRAGLATDIRLSAHGLNTEDHDFVIGLLGEKLFPLSAVVQRMRRTRQTSEFIEAMGPFFVGKAIWQPKYEDNQTII